MRHLSARCFLFLACSIKPALAEPPAAVPYPETTVKPLVPIDIPTPHMLATADEVDPASRHLRSESSECRSETQRPKVLFKNIGSMCVDGMYALMLGRGCSTIIGEKDPTGRWTTHKCKTQPSCDPVHISTFAVVPVGIPLTETFGDHVQIFCSDNNYRVIRLRKE